MDGSSGNLARRERGGSPEDEGRNTERKRRVGRLHAPFLLRADHRNEGPREHVTPITRDADGGRRRRRVAARDEKSFEGKRRDREQPGTFKVGSSEKERNEEKVVRTDREKVRQGKVRQEGRRRKVLLQEAVERRAYR